MTEQSERNQRGPDAAAAESHNISFTRNLSMHPSLLCEWTNGAFTLLDCAKKSLFGY